MVSIKTALTRATLLIICLIFASFQSLTLLGSQAGSSINAPAVTTIYLIELDFSKVKTDTVFKDVDNLDQTLLKEVYTFGPMGYCFGKSIDESLTPVPAVPDVNDPYKSDFTVEACTLQPSTGFIVDPKFTIVDQLTKSNPETFDEVFKKIDLPSSLNNLSWWSYLVSKLIIWSFRGANMMITIMLLGFFIVSILAPRFIKFVHYAQMINTVLSFIAAFLSTTIYKSVASSVNSQFDIYGITAKLSYNYLVGVWMAFVLGVLNLSLMLITTNKYVNKTGERIMLDEDVPTQEFINKCYNKLTGKRAANSPF